MISAALLGVGLIALAELHASSIRGVKQGSQVTYATAIATQACETLSSQAADVLTLPNCPGNGAPGCRLDQLQFTPDKTCTTWLATSEVPDPAGNKTVSVEGKGYRIDTVIEPHPDPSEFPNATLITTSVCWTDKGGIVHEIQTRRVVSPGA